MEKLTPENLVKMGLGAMLIAKDKAEELIEEAKKRGDLSKEEAKKAIDELKKEAKEKSETLQEQIKKEIHDELKELGVATKEDLASIRREITALKHMLEKKES